MKKSLLGLLLLSAAFVSAADKKNVLLIAGRPSHGPGEHEHNAGIQLLAAGLKQSAAELVNVDVALNGEWPSDERVAKADTIVIYSDGGGGGRSSCPRPRRTRPRAGGDRGGISS